MQKWEYLGVSRGTADNQFKAHYLNGAEMRDWKRGPSIYEFLTRLGDEGWEMISVSAPYDDIFWFKRPKP